MGGVRDGSDQRSVDSEVPASRQGLSVGLQDGLYMRYLAKFPMVGDKLGLTVPRPQLEAMDIRQY